MAMAAATCLARIAQTIEDDVVDHARFCRRPSLVILRWLPRRDGPTAWKAAPPHRVPPPRFQRAAPLDLPHARCAFADATFAAADCRRREASTLAFGSILEGPEQAKLAPVMPLAMDVMIKHMSDPSVQVKDTAAWTIGRICEHHITSITADHWSAMMRPQQPNQVRAAAQPRHFRCLAYCSV
eukprot:7159309-Prymnesium_polylepis.2